MNKKTGKEGSTFLDHIRELRFRFIVIAFFLIAATSVAFIFFDPIISLFLNLFKQNLSFHSEDILYINSLFEGFSAKLKISLLAGFVCSLPIILFNGVAFVFPGLKRREKGIASLLLAMSILATSLSVFYTYFRIVPVMIRFLTSLSFVPQNVAFLLGYEKNIFHIVRFLIVSIGVFQIPVILEAALIFKWISVASLIRSSRIVIVGSFLLSAIVTPPDIVSQIALALPLIILYFLVIISGKVFRLGR